jgi:N-acyl-D-aspartate/D-glutamate deacylase
LVIVHANTEENVRTAVLSPLTMIASDGFDTKPGEGHPRSSGSFSKILGQYVREERALKLEDAVAKMTLMPARRLEARVPAMKDKGRVRVGADADVVVFDPRTIRDRSSYEKPSEFSEGMRFVFVNGVAVVEDGRPVKGVFPGRGIRAEVR